MIKEITVKFKEEELLWDYSSLIVNHIKNNLVENFVIYSFPQIQKGWVSLKHRVTKDLLELNINRDFNVWFISDNTNNVLFKVFLF